MNLHTGNHETQCVINKAAGSFWRSTLSLNRERTSLSSESLTSSSIWKSEFLKNEQKIMDQTFANGSISSLVFFSNASIFVMFGSDRPVVGMASVEVVLKIWLWRRWSLSENLKIRNLRKCPRKNSFQKIVWSEWSKGSEVQFKVNPDFFHFRMKFLISKIGIFWQIFHP